MKVSANQPFEIIYSLYQHQYLGYLFESFVVQLDDKGRLTFQHQNISAKNAREFGEVLNEEDYKIIDLIDTMQQDAVVKKFSKKAIKPDDFFLKIYDKEKGNKLIQEEIERYLERRRSLVLSMIKGKRLFEMGNDGEPASKEIKVLDEKATILFHFRKNEENTHYFPTIKHCGVKVDFQYKGAYIICTDPAWMVIDCRLYHFEKEVDGKKLKPFLNKKFIVIPKSVEETYYNKFVAPLVASFDVYATGFQINSEYFNPIASVTFSELHHNQSSSLSLFDKEVETPVDEGKILFDLSYHYGSFKFTADHPDPVSVTVEKNDDNYIFHRVNRRLDEEKNVVKRFEESGLTFRNAKATMPKSIAFDWLNRNKTQYEEEGVIFSQKAINGKKYFVGTPTIDISVKEGIDWFDINAIIKFGDYSIPFKDLRNYIIKNVSEFKLPNGEYAVIPESWFVEYSDFFAFMTDDGENHTLKKHHLALVQELQQGNLAKVSISNKLQKLKDFEKIDDIPEPSSFTGELRPYQKAGYNWLHFLNQYNFGGCLADDMGLGKTVQTLAFLQSQKEQGQEGTSLLIMPTSLVYNWEMEAKKFTPDLKVLIYTGTQRNKDVQRFAKYDIVITSYGIARIDVDILEKYYFNYVILDESQAIKNPTSHTSKAVKQLGSRFRLILSGTPLENSTMDLWSQMSFINDGLLGSQAYFKNNFQIPIEKKGDETKTKKLFSLIKPFILRRHKSQVATDLPEKIENVHYCIMSEDQQQEYDEVKEYYRSSILSHISKNGLGKSQMMLLQGLTKLRQIANHPKMVDEAYTGESGKMRDVFHMLVQAIQEGHKILVFSQFVKHLNLFQTHLKDKGIAYAYLDGSTTKRQEEVDKFQNNPELQLFLISLKAGGLGLNLTKADYVFILDPWWNPATEAQAVDRAHRIGQESQVFTYRFITKNTVEEKIMALQQHKLKLATDLISTEESFMKKLSQEDIANILT
jgi:superfamily II DNA or RNA helicase